MVGDEYQKFMALDEEKRERILNAAMSEFQAGYKRASTDNIVREAGISKGLLFHYFGTKEKLYDFLLDYAIDTMQADFIDLVNTHQQDILDSIWQLSLLKQDLSRRYPRIFEFMARVYVDDKDSPAKEHLERFLQIRANVLRDVYAQCDHSLFREDIPPEKVIGIINMTMDGFAQQKLNEVEKDGIGEAMRENYDVYLTELKECLDILRKVFYKQAGSAPFIKEDTT